MSAVSGKSVIRVGFGKGQVQNGPKYHGFRMGRVKPEEVTIRTRARCGHMAIVLEPLIIEQCIHYTPQLKNSSYALKTIMTYQYMIQSHKKVVIKRHHNIIKGKPSKPQNLKLPINSIKPSNNQVLETRSICPQWDYSPGQNAKKFPLFYVCK